MKLPGPPPSVEEVLQKIQQISSYNHGNPNKLFQQRGAFSHQTDKSQFSLGPNAVNQGAAGKSSTAESANVHQQQLVQQPQQQGTQTTQMQNLPNGLPNQTNRNATPLPQGISRCVQSPEVYNWVM